MYERSAPVVVSTTVTWFRDEINSMRRLLFEGALAKPVPLASAAFHVDGDRCGCSAVSPARLEQPPRHADVNDVYVSKPLLGPRIDESLFDGDKRSSVRGPNCRT